MKSLYKVINTIGILVAVVLLLIIGFRAGQKYDIAIDENNDYVAISYSVNEQKIRRLMSLIDNHYVDQVNTDSLVDNTIKYILSNLDPHSVYLDKEISEQMDRQMKGYYIGIGVEYVMHHDTMLITRVNPKSPNKNLIMLGDRIVSVNDSSTIGLKSNEVANLIKGEPNSIVALAIHRDHKPLNIKAKRSTIKYDTMIDSYMLTNDIGYIKLKRFVDKSYTNTKKALVSLKHQGMKTLVFDLRGNPGGLMYVAEQIADEFLTKNQLIVFTKDAEGKKNMYYATNQGSFDGKPIYVLIDEESASASEIIAGAIQDNDAGTIVGRRSFGKGLVQREISLGDGTKLRLTTARYYTPSGRSIQKPYINGSNEDYTKDLAKRYMRGEFFSLDSIQVPDSLKYKTVKGRTVYGGGGIIPDIFVPLDSMKYSVWYYTYKDRNHFNEKILDYIVDNKDKFNKIKKEHFIAFFNPRPLAETLISEITGPKVYWKPEEERYFETFIKANIADYVYGRAASQRVWATEDKMLKTVIKLETEKE